MRVEGTTDKMMDFLKKNGINLSELSRTAGIPYKGIKGEGDPIVITAGRLSENRKKNKGASWKRARRNR